MKQFTCKEMGGSCNEMITGDTAEEVAQEGTRHVMETEDQAHQELKARMGAMTQEENDKWMEDFRNKFDEKPEM